jgi:hypothetical protein
MKKTVLLFIALVLSINIYGQDEKLVSLTTIGTGNTKEEAKNNALRTAIEQAFGTFVSSNTSVVNDNLVKDEIINVSNGNIKQYSILSENMLSDNSWVVSLKVDVSPSKLTRFAESKGLKVEFKGDLFAANVKLLELNKKNESIAIDNLYQVLCEIISKCYDYSLEVSEPKSLESGKWQTEIIVNTKLNDNIINITNLIQQTLIGLSIPKEQLLDYYNLNVKTYNCYIILKNGHKKEVSDNATKKAKGKKLENTPKENEFLNDLSIKEIYFRNSLSFSKVMYFLNANLTAHSLYFKISNGVNSTYGYDIFCKGEVLTKSGEKQTIQNLSGFYSSRANILSNYSPLVIAKYFLRGLHSDIMGDLCYKNIWSENFYNWRVFSQCNHKYPTEAYLLLEQASEAAAKNGDYFIKSYGGKKEYFFQEDQPRIFNLYSLQNNEIYFKINLYNNLSTEEISMVSEYKVEPVIMKNWFD